jgi:hypothetical protein
MVAGRCSRLRLEEIVVDDVYGDQRQADLGQRRLATGGPYELTDTLGESPFGRPDYRRGSRFDHSY